jgi:hypothetical protein
MRPQSIFGSSASFPFLQQFRSLIPPTTVATSSSSHLSSKPYTRICLSMIRNHTTLNLDCGNNDSSHSTSILGPQRTGHLSAPHLQFLTSILPISLCLPSTMAHPTITYRNPPHSSLRRLSIHLPILPDFPIRHFPAPAAIPTIDNITSQVLSMRLTRESRR